MPRPVALLVFIGLFSSVFGGAHYYIWARLVRDPALPKAIDVALTLALGLLFLTQPLGLWLLARGSLRAKRLVRVSFIWMGLCFLLLVATAAGEVLRVSSYVLPVSLPDNLSAYSSVPWARWQSAATALLCTMLGAIALVEGSRVHVRKLKVKLPNLPSAASGMTIVQWSDVHVGATIRRPFVERLVLTTNRLEPDVVVITGDLVDGSVSELRSEVAPIAQLKSRFGVYFVTGNHEYYSGVEEWCTELTRLSVRVLRNERLRIGDASRGFDLAGTDDEQGRRFGRGHGPDLAKALQGRDTRAALVRLAHQPRAIHEAARAGVGLQLSGHTHGGQIWPWGYLVRLQQPLISGLSRVGNTWVYVSNGTGYWGPPLRLGARAEITHITLEAEDDA